MAKWFLVLLLSVLALPAQAYEFLNDATLTTGDDTDRIIISADVTSATLTSATYSTKGAEFVVFKVVVSACPTSCNVGFFLEMLEPDGTWMTWDNETALTATNTGIRYIFGCKGGSTFCNTGNMSTTTSFIPKPMPTQFRVRMVWNSGTSWTGNVQAVLW